MGIINNTYISELEFHNRFDSELYNPYLKKSYNTLLQLSDLKILSEVCIIRSGSTPTDRDDSLKTGPILFKTTDIRNNILDPLDDYYHISSRINDRMNSTQIDNKDILLNIVGATLEVIGRSAYVTEHFIGSNITQAMVLLRIKGFIKDITSGFLFSYLNTKFAQDQIKRYARPTGQYNLNLQETGYIKIPKLSFGFQEVIDKTIIESGERLRESSYLYSQALDFLEKELGLDKIEFLHNNKYAVNFNEVINCNRSDADYYQTKYRQLEVHLNSVNTKVLSQVATFEKGIEVGSLNYSQEGKLFIRVSNLNNKKEVISSGSDKYISEDLFNKLKYYQPSSHNILLTKDGTPGICCNITEEVEGIISSGIVKIILQDSDIPNEYFALAVNSKICQMQIERDCSGALILHWKPEQIRKLKIPILDKTLMLELAELVSKSKEAQKESQSLLSSAIKQVEDLIEIEAAKN